MTKANYQAMSDAELRDWVRYHPQDTEAFHTLMDRLDLRPKVITRTDEEFATELQRRISQAS
ncbi:hypothetical protein [Nostoc sp. TCL26-01]|uniref:DUF6887 family protein n=1 Tax=Nostoc sp. TCL26-01 TaxID=2576904 RepID=UPI0015B964EF|nr:hypothetical protein [Nostoc sp. TCL26-01]QLE55049.1 hypothetical protein FD725_05700 [Nostoc sp. TCL26-01]